MEKFLEKMQEKLMPIATKIANQKFLIALRNSFIGTMPVVMAGSVAILINAFLVDFPDQFGWTVITDMFQWLININNLVATGSISIVSLLFIYSLGVNIAKIYDTDRLSSGIVSLSAFVIVIGNEATKTFELNQIDGLNLEQSFEGISEFVLTGNELTISLGGVLSGENLGTRGYFTAIIIGFLAAIIYSKIMNLNWTIKLPDTVPPAIAKPFLSIIPGLISLYIVATLAYIIETVSGELFIDLVYKVLQTPLLGMSQNFFAVIAMAFLIQLFWFFGLHGGNVMAPIMEGVFGVALLANLSAYNNGEPIPYIWTSVSFGSLVWYHTLGLLIVIFWTSTNEHYREVAKLGIVPVLFNIGEPVNYGLPTVLNPILFIPTLLAPVLMAASGYVATYLGWVSPVTQNVTWVMPPILYGFFSTAFDWRAIILSIFNLLIAIVIYYPFVKMADKKAEMEAKELAEENKGE